MGSRGFTKEMTCGMNPVRLEGASHMQRKCVCMYACVRVWQGKGIPGRGDMCKPKEGKVLEKVSESEREFID